LDWFGIRGSRSHSPRSPATQAKPVKYIVIKMEKCDGELDLSSLTSDIERWEAIAQIAEGLTTLHGMGRVHGDIRTKNIFVTGKTGNRRFKLGDFGETRDKGTRLGHGVNVYAAPEVAPDPFHDFVEENICSRPANDMYALGIVIYEMFALSESSYHERAEKLPKLTGRGRREDPYTQATPDYTPLDSVLVAAKKVIGQLLNTDPKKRMTAAGLLSYCLKHLADQEKSPLKKRREGDETISARLERETKRASKFQKTNSLLFPEDSTPTSRDLTQLRNENHLKRL